jgi:hypothetical protein
MLRPADKKRERPTPMRLPHGESTARNLLRAQFKLYPGPPSGFKTDFQVRPGVRAKKYRDTGDDAAETKTFRQKTEPHNRKAYTSRRDGSMRCGVSPVRLLHACERAD